jgi:chorismate-pyruvate lyase
MQKTGIVRELLPESLTALAETHDHHWRIITYSESVMSKSKLKEEIENLLTEKPYNCLETA